MPQGEGTEALEEFQNIREKIFNFLPTEDILNCRLVNQAWKEILDNPTFWLNKLNANGQPKSVSEAWLSMIEIAKD